MCRLKQLTSDLRIDAWYGSVETCPQEKAIVAEIQVDLSIDRRSAWQLDLSSRGGELDRTDEAGRPSDAAEFTPSNCRAISVSDYLAESKSSMSPTRSRINRPQRAAVAERVRNRSRLYNNFQRCQ